MAKLGHPGGSLPPKRPTERPTSASQEEPVRHLHFNPVYGEGGAAGNVVSDSPKRPALQPLSHSDQKPRPRTNAAEAGRRNSIGESLALFQEPEWCP